MSDLYDNSLKQDLCTSCIGDADKDSNIEYSNTITKHKKCKQNLLWSGVIICVIAFILLIISILI